MSDADVALPGEFLRVVDGSEAQAIVALRLSDGEVAPAVLVDGQGRILGLAKAPKATAGRRVPVDVRPEEIVGVRRVDGAMGRLGLGRWHRRTATGALHRRIRAWSLDSRDPYAHLRMLVRFIELSGNRMHHEETTPGGLRQIVMVDPLDFVAIRAEFEFPPSIQQHPGHDAIVCRNSRCELLGTRGSRR